MSRKATIEALQELHRSVAEELLNKVKSGEATAADMNAAIKFLQNNGIEATEDTEIAMKHLHDALPDFDDELDKGYAH